MLGLVVEDQQSAGGVEVEVVLENFPLLEFLREILLEFLPETLLLIVLVILHET